MMRIVYGWGTVLLVLAHLTVAPKSSAQLSSADMSNAHQEMLQELLARPVWLDEFTGRIRIWTCKWDPYQPQNVFNAVVYPQSLSVRELLIGEDGVEYWQAVWSGRGLIEGVPQLKFVQYHNEGLRYQLTEGSDRTIATIDEVQGAAVVDEMTDFLVNPFADLFSLNPGDGTFEDHIWQSKREHRPRRAEIWRSELDGPAGTTVTEVVVSSGSDPKLLGVNASKRLSTSNWDAQLVQHLNTFGHVLEWGDLSGKAGGASVAEALYFEDEVRQSVDSKSFSGQFRAGTLVSVSLVPMRDVRIQPGFYDLLGREFKVLDYVSGDAFEQPAAVGESRDKVFLARIDEESGPFMKLLKRDLSDEFPMVFLSIRQRVKTTKRSYRIGELDYDDIAGFRDLMVDRGSEDLDFRAVNGFDSDRITHLIEGLSGSLNEALGIQEGRRQTLLTRKSFTPVTEDNKSQARMLLTIAMIVSLVLGAAAWFGIHDRVIGLSIRPEQERFRRTT